MCYNKKESSDGEKGAPADIASSGCGCGKWRRLLPLHLMVRFLKLEATAEATHEARDATRRWRRGRGMKRDLDRRLLSIP